MTKQTGAKLGSLTILIAGIAIGYVASQSGSSNESAAQTATALSATTQTAAGNPNQSEQRILLAQNNRADKATAQPAKAENEIPDEWMPWKDPENPNVLVLEAGSRDGWKQRRDTSKDPKREAGLINPQRYEYGVSSHGFPTFFCLPMAFNTQDLKAGEVDVALFGSCADAQYLQGGKYAANKMRSLSQVFFWPKGASTDPFTRVDYFKELVCVDYGNAAANIAHNQRSLEEIAKVIVEIQDGDAIPIGIGGTHVQMYAWFMALAKVHGPGNFAMFHIDAHYDAQGPSNGIFTHNGSMIRDAIEKGLIKGENVVQVGLRSPVPGVDDLRWMREHKMRYHFMAEVERDGFDALAQRVFKELKGKKLFISVDMDGIDPADAPAVGTLAIGGIRAAEGARLLRGLSAQCEVIGAEFGEYNPLIDDAKTTTGIVMDRLIRATLAGIALRKTGNTDPNYLAPEALDHGVE